MLKWRLLLGTAIILALIGLCWLDAQSDLPKGDAGGPHRFARRGADATGAGPGGDGHAGGLAAVLGRQSSPRRGTRLWRQFAAGSRAVAAGIEPLSAAPLQAGRRVRLHAARRPDPRRQPVGAVGAGVGSADDLRGGDAAVSAAGRGPGQYRGGRVLPGLRRHDVFVCRADADLLGRRRVGGVDHFGQDGRHRRLYHRPALRHDENVADDQPRQDGGRCDGRDRLRLHRLVDQFSWHPRVEYTRVWPHPFPRNSSALR